jgi:hypothetical protein
MIRRDQAAGARHVFHDNRRVAGNIFTHVSGNRSGVGIKSAPGGKADNDPNHFTAVEFLARRGSDRCDCRKRANNDAYGQQN